MRYVENMRRIDEYVLVEWCKEQFLSFELWYGVEQSSSLASYFFHARYVANILNMYIFIT